MRSIPYLDLCGAAEADIGPDDSVPVLWPAYCWRISAPEPRTRYLNLFERALLNASRAGTFPAEKLASSFQLHSELVTMILADLVRRGLLEGTSGRPTNAGLQALQDEENIWEGAITGWVFQDPWTGVLHPHFARKLWNADFEVASDGSESISVGGTLVTPFKLDFPPSGFSRPLPAFVLRALRAHRRRQQARKHMGEEWESELQEPEEMLPIDRVEFLEDQGWPIYLLTFGRIAREGIEPTLEDLFGLGEAPGAWEQLKRLALRNKDKVAQRCVEAVEQLSTQRRRVDLPAELIGVQRVAEEHVVALLSTQIMEFDQVYGHLVRMEEHLRFSAIDETRFWRWSDDMRVAARKALEAAVWQFEQAVPPVRRLDALVTDDEEKNRQFLNGNARLLGFEIPLPPEMTIRRKRDMKQKATNLHQWAIVVLLRASTASDCRLKKIASIEPRFFELFRSVRQESNQGAHDSKAADVLDESGERVATAALCRDCYRVISLLLDLPLKKSSSPPPHVHGQKTQ